MKNDELEILYFKYYREIYLYAFSLCQDYYLAEDLTNESFLKAYLTLDDDINYFKYWIFRVCKNLYFDILTKEKKKVNLSNSTNFISDYETPLDKIIEDEEKKRIYNLVVDLKDTYREVIILFYYSGFTIKQISKIQDVSEGLVKTNLYRARKKLKKKMEVNYVL